jgi:hypothetical protein
MTMTDQYALSYVDDSLAEQKQDLGSNNPPPTSAVEEERLRIFDTFGAPKGHAPGTKQLDAPIQQARSEQANVLSTEIQTAVSNPFPKETANATNEKFPSAMEGQPQTGDSSSAGRSLPFSLLESRSTSLKLLLPHLHTS